MSEQRRGTKRRRMEEKVDGVETHIHPTLHASNLLEEKARVNQLYTEKRRFFEMFPVKALLGQWPSDVSLSVLRDGKDIENATIPRHTLEKINETKEEIVFRLTGNQKNLEYVMKRKGTREELIRARSHFYSILSIYHSLDEWAKWFADDYVERTLKHYHEDLHCYYDELIRISGPANEVGEFDLPATWWISGHQILFVRPLRPGETYPMMVTSTHQVVRVNMDIDSETQVLFEIGESNGKPHQFGVMDKKEWAEMWETIQRVLGLFEDLSSVSE